VVDVLVDLRCHRQVIAVEAGLPRPHRPDHPRQLARLWPVQARSSELHTIPEFEYNLGLLSARRGFGMLYLAFHGSRGRVELPSGELDLEQLGQMMRRGFRRWIIHFGTCSTIDVPLERLDAFLSVTGAAMVMGYKRDVDWVESARAEFIGARSEARQHDPRPLRSGTRWSPLVRCCSEVEALLAYEDSRLRRALPVSQRLSPVFTVTE
jgi:hypothetical protein